jgi:hypothetical protein
MPKDGPELVESVKNNFGKYQKSTLKIKTFTQSLAFYFGQINYVL